MYETFIYSQVIKELILEVKEHLQGKSTIHNFQKAVQKAEMSI